MNKKVVIIGAGGHGKVIADIVEKSKDEILGFLDDNIEVGENIVGQYKVIGRIDYISSIQGSKEDIEFIIAIGDNKKREEISKKYNSKFYTAVHPSAQMGLDVRIGNGTVIMANTVINSATKIGNHCIINTGSIIEHDNLIDDFVHVSPNATTRRYSNNWKKYSYWYWCNCKK